MKLPLGKPVQAMDTPDVFLSQAQRTRQRQLRQDETTRRPLGVPASEPFTSANTLLKQAPLAPKPEKKPNALLYSFVDFLKRFDLFGRLLKRSRFFSNKPTLRFDLTYLVFCASEGNPVSIYS